ncbi:conserved hypothetical protein [Verticillium alfalfae VaMs.102]|uniref:TRUD domain-containing protein n=1 Tax=Verticillium alfalfae (strain VaMs.102 / ATCC MYA-4576 / FGSC 10136) TaxID=526221 RepID=C9SEC5_VERA1|nr:conserved hypothetical protein [Verticillium alfalfae VaMs.102]EEY16518.1 conserved hypothetical protein [Verticillium alfalfae VaMs.102]
MMHIDATRRGKAGDFGSRFLASRPKLGFERPEELRPAGKIEIGTVNPSFEVGASGHRIAARRQGGLSSHGACGEMGQQNHVLVALFRLAHSRCRSFILTEERERVGWMELVVMVVGCSTWRVKKQAGRLAQDKPQIGAHGVRLNRGLGITERIAPKMESWTGETRVRFTDFPDITSAEFAASLVAIYQAAAAKKTIPPPARSPPLEDKDQRGQLHQLVRRVFHSLIDTTTDNSDPSLAGAIIVASGRPPRPSKAYSQANRMKTGSNRRNAKGKVKAEGEGEYLHFTLYKENRDTMDAIHQLARAGRAKPQHFAFAGTKDRRAATAQRCSVRWLKAENLHGVQARVHGLVTGDYRYERHPLHLGGLLGNEFVITLKKCHLADPASEALPAAAREAAIRGAAETALESMASRGCFNYFEHQRIGT